MAHSGLSQADHVRCTFTTVADLRRSPGDVSVRYPISGGATSSSPLRRDSGSAARPRRGSLLQQHEIIPMDDLVPPSPPQDRLNLIGPVPDNPFRVRTAIGA